MVNRKIQQVLLSVAILTVSSGAVSREISYDFIQGSYVSTSIDADGTSGDIDGNGAGIAGSFVIVPNIAVTTDFVTTSFDTFQGVDSDTTEITLGVTGYGSVADNTRGCSQLSHMIVATKLNIA